MSDQDSFVNEGGSIEVERQDATYSPAAGLGNDTVESDRTADSEESDGVALTLGPGNKGQFVDSKTGKRFRRGRTVTVPESEADRLLGLRRKGKPVLVRADS